METGKDLNIFLLTAGNINYMDKGDKYFLETGRLGFRKWSADDMPLAVKLWGDYNVTRYIDARGKLTDNQVEEKLNREIETDFNYGIQYWPLFLKDTEEFIGCCGLRPYDPAKNIAEIGFHICSDFWRNGYAMEAASSVIKYAFNNLNFSALFAGHNPQNEASSVVLKKLGFSYISDEFYKPTGLYHPSYLLKNNIDIPGVL